MVKKIVISPNNTKAIAFFAELDRKKKEMKDKLRAKSSLNRVKSIKEGN